MRHWLLGLVVIAACRDLALPVPPGQLPPGTLQGTVVYAVPGRAGFFAGGGAKLRVVGTSIETVAEAQDGRFTLEGITSSTGQVSISLDVDRDGVVDRQRVLDLETLKAGRGRDVSLGEVVLARNATLVGKVRRAGVATPGGHGGLLALVVGFPAAATTSDDGSYVLQSLPEGSLEVAFAGAGLATDKRKVVTVGGGETRAADVELSPAPPGVASARGLVTRLDGSPVASAKVRFVAEAMEANAVTDAKGEYAVMNLRPSVYQVAVEAPGFASVLRTNVPLDVGDNDLQPVSLVAGQSMVVPLDGGVVLGDAGVGGGSGGSGGNGGGGGSGGGGAVEEALAVPVALVERVAILAVAAAAGVYPASRPSSTLRCSTYRPMPEAR